MKVNGILLAAVFVYVSGMANAFAEPIPTDPNAPVVVDPSTPPLPSDPAMMPPADPSAPAPAPVVTDPQAPAQDPGQLGPQLPPKQAPVQMPAKQLPAKQLPAPKQEPIIAKQAHHHHHHFFFQSGKQVVVKGPVQEPIKQAPVQVPVKQAPVQVPVKQAPIKQYPVKQAPVQAPIKKGPVQVPVQYPGKKGGQLDPQVGAFAAQIDLIVQDTYELTQVMMQETIPAAQRYYVGEFYKAALRLQADLRDGDIKKHWFAHDTGEEFCNYWANVEHELWYSSQYSVRLGEQLSKVRAEVTPICH